MSSSEDRIDQNNTEYILHMPDTDLTSDQIRSFLEEIHAIDVCQDTALNNLSDTGLPKYPS